MILKKLLWLLLFILLPVLHVVARDYPAYNLRSGKPYFRYRPYEEIRPLINKLGTGYYTRLNGVLHYWNPKKLWVKVWPSRKTVFMANSSVERIYGLGLHPKYGKVARVKLHSRKVVFIQMKTGLRIRKWGSWRRAGSLQRYRNRYVFTAAKRWRNVFYVDTENGKPVSRWGVWGRMGILQKAGKHYYIRVRKRRGYWTFLNADTGEQIEGQFSRIGNNIHYNGRRYFFKGKKRRARNYSFFDLKSGESFWGEFRSINKIFRTRRRHLFIARRQRRWSLYDARAGRELISGMRGLRYMGKIGKRYFLMARKREEGRRVMYYYDLDRLKRYGDGYNYIKDLRYLGGRYYYKARRDNLWYYIRLGTGGSSGEGYSAIHGKPVQAGRDYYYVARSREDGVTRTFYVNLRTGRIAGGKHRGRVKALRRAGRRYLFQVLRGGRGYYVNLRTGRRIGDEYRGMGYVYTAGNRSFFNARTSGRREYWVIDARSGRRLHGPFRYLSLNRNVYRLRGRYVFRARTASGSTYFDLYTGRPLWKKYFGSVWGLVKIGNRAFFKARMGRNRAYIDAHTGKPAGGFFYRVGSLQRLGKRVVFLARKGRKLSFYDLMSGKRLWGPFSHVDRIREVGNTRVIKVRVGRYSDENKKEYYLDTTTGRPWVGIFDEVKSIRFSKGMISFLARTGDTWKTIYPFKHVKYNGMKFYAGAKTLYPSRMSVASSKGRVMGSVVLKNPFNESITIRLELSSPSFPVFYGKKASILGAEVKLRPRQSIRQPLLLPFSEKFWNLFKKKIINCSLTAKIKTAGGRIGSQRIDLNVTIASRDRMKWDDIRNIAVYANVEDPTIKELARVVKQLNVVRNWQVSPRIDMPLKAYEACRTLGLNYSFMSLGLGDEDTIKMPYEIIKERLGKCTDTTILYATLLSRLGYSTIITTYSYRRGSRKISHLMMLVDTGVDARYYRFLARNKSMLVVPKGMSRCYIPVETTGMVSENGKSMSFLKAWKHGLAQYRQHRDQILNPKNTFRLQAAWKGGFAQMSPNVKSSFRFPQRLMGGLKGTLRDLQYRYVKRILESQKEERRLRKRAAGKKYKSIMRLGHYYYRVRRYSDAGKQYLRAVNLRPRNSTALYYYLSTLVYSSKADDPRITYPQRRAASKKFPGYAGRLSRILKRIGSRTGSEAHYAMNYDLGKWYNAFRNTRKGAWHTKMAKGIRSNIDRRRAVRYSARFKRRLRARGFSEKMILALATKGFSEKMVLSLATKGFSEKMILSLATKGFSEKMVLSLATKGFSEKMVLSLATKGFSEKMVLSLAIKGFSEESWSISR